MAGPSWSSTRPLTQCLAHRVVQRLPRDRGPGGRAQCLHVHLVLRQRNGRGAHVVVVLQKQPSSSPAGVGDPVEKRGSTHDAAAGDLDVVLIDEQLEHRFDDRKVELESVAELGARQLPREMQGLERQLQDQVHVQTGLFERAGCRGLHGCGKRLGRHHVRALSEATGRAAPPDARAMACLARRRGAAQRGFSWLAAAKTAAASRYSPRAMCAMPRL